MVYIILFAFVFLFFLLTGAGKKRMEYRERQIKRYEELYGK